MKLRKILKSTAVIVTPPTVRVLPTLLRKATAKQATPKIKSVTP